MSVRRVTLLYCVKTTLAMIVAYSPRTLEAYLPESGLFKSSKWLLPSERVKLGVGVVGKSEDKKITVKLQRVLNAGVRVVSLT